METKKVEEIKEQKTIVPVSVLDMLDRMGKPYALVVRETDSVIAKNLSGSKIETHTNMVGDAYLNSLQSAYQIFINNTQKQKQKVGVDVENKS